MSFHIQQVQEYFLPSKVDVGPYLTTNETNPGEILRQIENLSKIIGPYKKLYIGCSGFDTYPQAKNFGAEEIIIFDLNPQVCAIHRIFIDLIKTATNINDFVKLFMPYIQKFQRSHEYNYEHLLKYDYYKYIRDLSLQNEIHILPCNIANLESFIRIENLLKPKINYKILFYLSNISDWLLTSPLELHSLQNNVNEFTKKYDVTYITSEGELHLGSNSITNIKMQITKDPNLIPIKGVKKSSLEGSFKKMPIPEAQASINFFAGLGYIDGMQFMMNYDRLNEVHSEQALMSAAANGSLDIMNLILSRFDNIPNEILAKALDMAASKGNLDAMSSIMLKFHEITTYNLATAFIKALISGQLDAIQLIMGNPCFKRVTNEDLQKALKDVLKNMSDQGLDGINFCDLEKTLMWTITHNKNDVLHLIQNDQINKISNEDLGIALIYALMNKNTDIIDYILKIPNFNEKAKDFLGKFFMLALINENSDALEILMSNPSFEIPVDYQKKAIEWALKQPNTKVLKIILNNKSFEIPFESLQDALTDALKYKNLEALSLILNNPIIDEIPTDCLGNALIYAVKEGYINGLNLLMNSSKFFEINTYDLESALVWAIQSQNLSALDLLININPRFNEILNDVDFLNFIFNSAFVKKKNQIIKILIENPLLPSEYLLKTLIYAITNKNQDLLLSITWKYSYKMSLNDLQKAYEFACECSYGLGVSRIKNAIDKKTK